MNQSGEISVCAPQILQNAVSPSVGLLIYYCGICSQGFTSEADINQHIPQHFSSIRIDSGPTLTSHPSQDIANPSPQTNPIPSEEVNTNEEKQQEIKQVSPVITATPHHIAQNPSTYYILIPQSQVMASQPTAQQTNAVYINGTTAMPEGSTSLISNSTPLTLAVDNTAIQGVQQTSNGTTLYQIIDPQAQAVLAHSENNHNSAKQEAGERMESASSVSDCHTTEDPKSNISSETKLITLPQGANNRVVYTTELPVASAQPSQLAIIPQNTREISHSNLQIGGYSSHIPAHFKKRHVCDICTRAFTQRGSLKYHRMLHTGEKPFQCNVCDKSFRIRAPFDAHMDVHNGVRYRCSICLKYYSSRATLRQHLKGQHPNMPHPPISSCGFQCSSINLSSDEVTGLVKQ